MASYTRQSTFVDGDTITAAIFNNEFNQLLAAFNNSTGHKHDGTTAEGPVIGLIGDAGETSPNNKVLIDTSNNHIEFYVEVSSSSVQQLRIQDGAIVPITDNDIDLGTSSLEFKDAFFDGTVTTDALVADTADINGGTIDGVTIGGSSAGAITGTAITGTSFVIGSADINEAELETIDDVTAGTVAASKAVVVDSNKDIASFRNVTLTGELDAATLDISGDADIDGTLEADAITIAGVTLAETISDTVGAMVSSNTETGIAVTYDDSDNTLDFVIGSGVITNDMLAGSIANAKLSNSSITVSDGSSSTAISLGGTLTFAGTSNEVEVGESSGTITVGLPSATQITTSLGVGGGSTNGVQISQGAIAIKNGGTQSYVDFYCESSNAHYARLQAPAHSAFSGNITATLPATTGTLALTSDDITGTAAVATSVTVSANNSTDETIFPVFVDGATGSQGLETDTGFTYNPSSGNLTIGGALTAASLDISGDVDVDGTLEADAITVNGTTLAETISDTVGAMVSSNTETGISVTYDDSDNTLDFVIGSDVIVNSMIADDAIDSAQLADGSIDTVHIADDQVTGDKLSNDITIANDLTVAGNLVVTGSTTQTGSTVSNSNFQSLSNNNSGNATDFGFFGKYVESSTTKYAGLFFDASTDNTFRLFVDTQTEPSTTVNTSATGYAVGTLVANVTGNVSGTAATVTGAAQSNITSLGTLTTLTVDNVIINGTTIGHTDDTDLMTVADGVLTVAGEVDAVSLDVSGDIDVDGTANLDNTDIDGTLNTSGVVTSQTSANISQVALTDGTVSWDAAAAANAFLLLEENSTISAPSNAVEGAIISIEVAQHASSGPYTLAWNAIFEFAGDTTPTQTATDAKTDIYAFRYNGSKWQNIGITQNLTQS
jgi:cytoskeletal protein CcmA (bactofilin family)